MTFKGVRQTTVYKGANELKVGDRIRFRGHGFEPIGSIRRMHDEQRNGLLILHIHSEVPDTEALNLAPTARVLVQSEVSYSR